MNSNSFNFVPETNQPNPNGFEPLEVLYSPQDTNLVTDQWNSYGFNFVLVTDQSNPNGFEPMGLLNDGQGVNLANDDQI